MQEMHKLILKSGLKVIDAWSTTMAHSGDYSTATVVYVYRESVFTIHAYYKSFKIYKYSAVLDCGIVKLKKECLKPKTAVKQIIDLMGHVSYIDGCEKTLKDFFLKKQKNK